jgi:hypothetical protein
MTSHKFRGHGPSINANTHHTSRPAFHGGFFFEVSMIKRLILSLALAAGLVAPAHSAGTIPGFSLQPQFDNAGHLLVGCQFYTIQAGTTSTPQNAYQDTALTLPLPNPQTCDASGRLPQMFVADGLIKIRLTDRNGVTQIVADNILVIGPSGGGGGGGTVDPTTILATGDIKSAYGTSVLSGWVRANGRTIGSATSGATERANADTQALFVYLWGADASLAVSGGRGASAAADWAANKAIALPDFRGRVIASLDDMGNTAAGRLSSTYFGATPTTLGAVGGTESKTLVTANLPPYTPGGSISITAIVQNARQYAGGTGSNDNNSLSLGNNAGTLQQTGVPFISGTAGFTGTAQGGTSTPLSAVQPTILVTTYLKL